MPKTRRVIDVDHPSYPDWLAWCEAHELEPSLMSRVVTIGDDGTILINRYVFTPAQTDDDGTVTTPPWFVTTPGHRAAVTQPKRVTPTRPIPDHVLEEIGTKPTSPGVGRVLRRVV